MSSRQPMRFHQAESAFFVFIFVILAAGLVMLHSYDYLQTAASESQGFFTPENVEHLKKLVLATGVLLATALFFGMFFIYPLIRRQVREEGKLRAMTETLSARSETLRRSPVSTS